MATVGLVVDASVAIGWLVASQRTDVTRRAQDVVIADGALVPQHFRLEVGSALIVLERRGRLNSTDVDLSLDDLDSLSIAIDDTAFAENERRIIALARSHRLSVYDALYLELALRTDLPLATRDTALAAAAAAAGATLLTA